MLQKAYQLYEQGHNPGEEANLSKLQAADASWQAAEACLQTFGGFGFATEYNVERKYRKPGSIRLPLSPQFDPQLYR